MIPKSTSDSPTPRTTIRLQSGHPKLGAAKAQLAVIRGGKRNTYLWIGNNAPGDGRCYATLSGPATLRKLARAILDEVGE